MISGRNPMRFSAVFLFLLVAGCAYFNSGYKEGKFPLVTQSSLDDLYKSLNKNRQKLAHELIKKGFICYRDREKDGFGQYALKCYRGQCVGGYLEDSQIRIVEQYPLVEEASAGAVLYHGGCKESDVKDYKPLYLDRFIYSDMERLN